MARRPYESATLPGQLAEVFRQADDLNLVRELTASGLVSPSQVELAREEALRAVPRSLPSDVLVAQGWLSESQREAMRRKLAADEFGRLATDETLPQDAREAATDPARVLDDLVLVQCLGRGGMGEVWKAWDRSLGRHVAVKLPVRPLQTHGARTRFLREAVTAGRLSHPSLVPLHRVGHASGRPYLVMRYLEGRTLDQVTLPLPQALAVVRKVAEAVDHAHRAGVVHRDLKPRNLLLDHAEHIWVLDFGVAYLMDGGGEDLTVPGELLGTPAFMAPEQARGGPEARTTSVDVYSLGATLYFVVTGRAPFAGDSFAEVIAQVLGGAPVSPRSLVPALPEAVATVIAKAMARDPADRYASAAALAEDLGRILDGVPVAARRPPAPWSTARVLVLAAVAVALSATAGIATHRIRMARAQSAAVEALRALARVSLESALRLRRAGDTAGMRSLLPHVEGAYAEARARAPELAEIEYIMGRMRRALLDEKAALLHQERALARDPLYRPALYERALLLSRRYGQEMARFRDLEGGGSGPATAERARELEALRRVIIQDTERLVRGRLDLVDGQAVQGILALHRGHLKDAQRLLETAAIQDPSREEVWEHLALVEQASGQHVAAVEVYTRALERDRGYVPHLIGRCRARLLAIDVGAAPSLPGAAASYTAAAGDAARALHLAGNSVDAALCLSWAHRSAARDLVALGRDPSAEIAAAQAPLDRALRSDPGARDVWTRTGFLHYLAALGRVRRGLDPEQELRAAQDSFSRAMALAAPPTLWIERAKVHILRGEHGALTGQDPDLHLAAAEADLETALRGRPGDDLALRWRAHARIVAASHLLAGVSDGAARATDLLGKAEADLGAIFRAGAVAPEAHLARALLRHWQGEVLRQRGADPEVAWGLADRDFEQATRGRAHVPEVWTRWAALLRARAEHQHAEHRPMAAAGAEARRHVEHALAASPDWAEAWAESSRLHHVLGHRRSADEDRDRALGINPLLRISLGGSAAPAPRLNRRDGSDR